MNLSPEQFQRMQYLLGKSKRVGLTPEEQEELKRLVKQENPSAAGETIGAILAAAAIIIGIVTLIDAFTKK